MTPQEKAKELIDKFRKYVDFTDQDFNTSFQYEMKRAKKCAEISVDEILNLEPPELSYLEPFSKSYWQEVKTEINKP